MFAVVDRRQVTGPLPKPSADSDALPRHHETDRDASPGPAAMARLRGALGWGTAAAGGTALVAATLRLGFGGFPGGDAPGPLPESARPTNLVFVVLDTTRADAMGYAGYGRPLTPNLDALAADSIVFDRAYAHAPWTMPSVASMFTSLTPMEHGITDWDHPLERRWLTLAEVLSDAGFATRAVVSHHAFEPVHQFDQGFDVYDWSIAEQSDPSRSANSNLVTDSALAAIDGLGVDDRPFFLWVHYFDAHWLYLHHDDFDYGDSPRDRYDSELAFQDAALGRLLDGMAERGLFENTALVVVGNHGEEFKEHGHKQHTRQLYEESVRIPMVWRLPGFSPARVEEVVAAVDIAPTLLTLLGLPVPPDFHGRAMASRRAAAGWSLAPTPDRVVALETMRITRRQGLVDGRHKLIHDLTSDRWELYDLSSDPAERSDLADSHPRELARQRAELDRLLAGGRTETERVVLGDELMERLRSLGYTEE